MTLHPTGPGVSPAVRVAARQFPANGAGMCRKGWTAAELLTSPDRLTGPLVRDRPAGRPGPLRPATWDEALDRIAVAVGSTQHRYGNDAVGVFGGGGLTNEKAYQLGKFARVALRTSCIDYNGRFCMSSAASAGVRAFGLDRGLPFPLTDIARADVLRLPLPDAIADVVTAGEILEHVTDLPAAVAEACRVLRPGGTLVLDTIARTRAARLIAITVAEAVPGGAPRGIHDPALLVDRDGLRRECARHGVPVHLTGLRPSIVDALLWLLRRRDSVRMVPMRSTSVLFQGHGTKEGTRDD
jgi:SAM-dependent methyltransferase